VYLIFGIRCPLLAICEGRFVSSSFWQSIKICFLTALSSRKRRTDVVFTRHDGVDKVMCRLIRPWWMKTYTMIYTETVSALLKSSQIQFGIFLTWRRVILRTLNSIRQNLALTR
jgi:Zn-dependent protease with chaperone function